MSQSEGQADSPEEELRRHLKLIGGSTSGSRSRKADRQSQLYSLSTTPLTTWKVKQNVADGLANDEASPFNMYGLLGRRTATYGRGSGDNGDFHDARSTLSGESESTIAEVQSSSIGGKVVYSNTSAPWSAFICGQQGAGKSYTFSCLLENALLADDNTGRNSNPLTGIIFHYDKHSAYRSTQICEAAFLCSQGVKVEVLVSPTNVEAMKTACQDLQGWSQMDYMLTLMNHSDADKLPLYMATVVDVVREMKIQGQSFTIAAFRAKMREKKLDTKQQQMFNQRMALLETFMYSSAITKMSIGTDKTRAEANMKKGISSGPGRLTIVDLSCSTMGEGDVCTFYEICLSMFLANRHQASSLIIGIDEAHKFLTDSPEAKHFTEELIRLIRQQRHLKSRVIIATQEPTLSPQLMDLCDVSIIHRFRTPAWFSAIKGHLAGLAWSGDIDNSTSGKEVFERIVRLRDGEALVFASEAVLDVEKEDDELSDNEVISTPSNGSIVQEDDGGTRLDDGEGRLAQNMSRLEIGSEAAAEVLKYGRQRQQEKVRDLSKLEPLKTRYFKIEIRKRLTTDGGKSQMAV